MEKKTRSWKFLFLSLVSFTVLCLTIYFIPPKQSITFLNVAITTIPLFYILTFIFFFSLGRFIFKSTVHGVLIGLLFIMYLLFRENDLTHPFFALLLAALFLVLELLFSYKK